MDVDKYVLLIQLLLMFLIIHNNQHLFIVRLFFQAVVNAPLKILPSVKIAKKVIQPTKINVIETVHPMTFLVKTKG